MRTSDAWLFKLHCVGKKIWHRFKFHVFRLNITRKTRHCLEMPQGLNSSGRYICGIWKMIQRSCLNVYVKWTVSLLFKGHDDTCSPGNSSPGYALTCSAGQASVEITVLTQMEPFVFSGPDAHAIHPTVLSRASFFVVAKEFAWALVAWSNYATSNCGLRLLSGERYHLVLDMFGFFASFSSNVEMNLITEPKPQEYQLPRKID